MAFRALLSFLPLASLIAAAPGFEPRSPTKRCVNSAEDRTCWGDYDISTNYYDEVPDTGVTREYYFNLVNTTASPDGVEKMVLTVNGTVPGPTIVADWGDTVVVHVTNSLVSSLGLQSSISRRYANLASSKTTEPPSTSTAFVRTTPTRTMELPPSHNARRHLATRSPILGELPSMALRGITLTSTYRPGTASSAAL